MSFSAADHPILGALLGDAETAAFFAFDADWRAMLAFEAALAKAEAAHGLIPAASAARIAEVCERLPPDVDALAAGAARDGVVAVELVKQLRLAVGAPAAAHVHFGATSQDVVDTSLMIRLQGAAALFDRRLALLIEAMHATAAEAGATALMAHTRMQRALPFTVADKLQTWSAPMLRHRQRLAALGPTVFAVQFGGPVGVRGELAGKGEPVAVELSRALGLANAPSWHSQRDGLFEFAAWLANVAGTLGKIGQDVALMAQNEIAEVRLSGGGGSSAMAHKANPVGAEVLVALARYGAALHGGLAQALIHENERSGAAWTLEWLTLPPLAGAVGAATRIAITLCKNMNFLPQSAKLTP